MEDEDEVENEDKIEDEEEVTNDNFVFDPTSEELEEELEEEPEEESSGWNILNSNVLNENEALLNDLSLQDLDEGVVVSEEKEEIDKEDEETVKTLLELLTYFGYVDLQDASLDTLLLLEDIEASLLDKSQVVNAIKSSLEQSMQSMKYYIQHAKATDNKRDDTLNYDLLKVNTLSSFNDAVHSSILDYIFTAAARGNYDLKAGEVVGRVLKTTAASGMGTNLDLDHLVSYAEQMIPQIIKRYKEARHDDMTIDIMRKRTADLMLQHDEMELQKFLHVGEENIYFIRNIFQNGDRYFIVCDACGNSLELTNAPLDLYRVPMNKSTAENATDGSFYFPKPVACSCGAFHIASVKDYVRMEKSLHKFYKGAKKRSRTSQLQQAISTINTLCTGASFLKVVPPFQGVVEGIPHLIREKQQELEQKETENLENSKQRTLETTVLFDDLEFREAAKAFYEKLECFQAQRDMVTEKMEREEAQGWGEDFSIAAKREPQFGGMDADVLDIGYKQMAAVMVDLLGLDYVTVKTQAIFSLCYYFSEHPYFASNFDILKIYELERAVDLIQISADKKAKKLSPLQMEYLKELYYSYYEGKPGLNMEEILGELTRQTDFLVTELQTRKQNWEQALRFLKEHIFAFRYCKLINLASYQREELDRFVNRQSFPVIDIITDQMMVTNLAGDYYEQWFYFNIIKKRDLKDSLVVKAAAKTALVTLTSAIVKHLSKQQIQVDGDQITAFLQVVIEPSVEEHRWLRDAYNYLKACDYYRFYHNILKCPSDFNSYLGRNFSDAVVNAITKITREVPIAEGEGIASFYLSEDFSKEEIASLEDDLELLPFGRFLPKRQEGETLEHYVVRFQQMFQEEKLDKSNSYDFYSKTFEKVKESVIVVSTAALFSGMEYNSYMTSVFMERCIQLFFQINSKKAFYSFFNLSDEYLNSVLSGTEFLNAKDFEVSLSEKFYRMKYEFYFTDVSSIVQNYCSQYSSQVVRSSDDLAERNRVSGKLRYIEEIMDEVNQYNPILTESADTKEDLMKELEFVLGTELVSQFSSM